MEVWISQYLKEQVLEALKAMLSKGASKEYLPDDKSFFVSVEKEKISIAEIKYQGGKYYLCQVFGNEGCDMRTNKDITKAEEL